MRTASRPGFNDVLALMRAAAEETRLRVLALLAEGELSVSELTEILRQSQPRISRHLKLLYEAGLVDRHREGSWVFFRLAADGTGAQFARDVVARIDPVDGIVAADRSRLQAVREARAREAQAFFARLAPNWERLRYRHGAEDAVEATVRALVADQPVRSLVDLGTGTGRMLALLAPLAERAIGVDASPAMLAVARVELEKARLRRVELRQGDIYALPLARDQHDLVVVHQVLHFLDDPARALAEAAAILEPRGRLVVVDYAPHGNEELRTRHGHRRLGFAREQIEAWMAEAGVMLASHRDLPPPEPEMLAVSIWLGVDRRPAVGRGLSNLVPSLAAPVRAVPAEEFAR
jgi:ubiquinone/menaquinone biosynthesis C-methylase UbiE